MDLAARLRSDIAEDRATLVRLTGPGAVAAAHAARSVHGFRQTIPLGELPATSDILWFHDGPGARVQADLCVAAISLLGTSAAVVLTGRATDGGHPDLVETLHIPGPAEAPAATLVELPVVPDSPGELEIWIREQEDLGEITAAHAGWELLVQRAPDRGAVLAWIDLERLLSTGRSAEVLSRAREICRAAEGREHALLQVAIAAFVRAEPDRCEGLLAVVADGDDPLAARKARRQIHVLRHGPAQIALTEETGEIAIARGRLRRATFMLPPCAATDTYIDDPVIAVHHSCRRALKAGDSKTAQHLLDRLPQRAQRWWSNRRLLGEHHAILAAHRGDIWSLRQGLEERSSDDHLRRLLSTATQVSEHARAVILNAVLEHGAEEALRTEARSGLTDLKGPVVLGEYELVDILGHGAMGTVWRARHASLDTEVAIKLVRGDKVAERFRAEVELVTRLEHPAIVGVLDFGDVPPGPAVQSGGSLREGDPFLVMELVAGGTLADHIGRLSFEDVGSLTTALLDALAYAHSLGIVHRDIKPLNVLVTPDRQIRLADFGLAPDDGRAAGTPMYISPEQIQGRAEPASDLYSLGCTIWQLVAGAAPFIGSPKQLLHAHRTARPAKLEPMFMVPVGLEPWLRRCLAKRPEDRFSSAFAAQDAFSALGPCLPLASPPSRPPMARHPQSATTFLLDELLCRPAKPRVQTEIGARRVAPPEPRRAYRPRPPTANLLNRGDPPLVGHAKAREHLREALNTVLQGDGPVLLALRGAHGSGRRALVREVRNVARAQGIGVSAEPGAGVAVIDARRTPLAEWTPRLTPHSPWLVVWTDPPENLDVPSIRVGRTDPLALYFVARSRIPLSPYAATLASHRAAGRPGLLLAILEGWCTQPGFVPGSEGLQLRGEPEPENAPARAFWEEALRAASAEVRSAVEVAAHLVPMFSEQSFDNVTEELGQRLPLPRDFLDYNGGFHVPPELQSVCLERSVRSRRIHTAAAAATHTESVYLDRQLWHALRTGDLTQRPRLVARIRHEVILPALIPANAPSPAILRLANELALDHDPAAQAWLDLAQVVHIAADEPERAEALCTRVAALGESLGEPVLVAAAHFTRIRAARRGHVSFPDDLEPTERSLVDLPPEERGPLTRMLAWALSRRGERARAEALRRRSLADVVGTELEGAVTAVLEIDRSLEAEDGSAEMEAHLRAALVGPEHDVHATIRWNLAHVCLHQGRFSEAAVEAKRATELHAHHPAPWLNLAIVDIELGRFDEALDAALLAARTALLRRLPWADLGLILALTLARDWPDTRWWDLANSMSRPWSLFDDIRYDAAAVSALDKALERIPAGPRAAYLAPRIQSLRSWAPTRT